jgi:hypothetical protein
VGLLGVVFMAFRSQIEILVICETIYRNFICGPQLFKLSQESFSFSELI